MNGDRAPATGKVLVVDDDPDVLTVIVDALSNRRLTVVAARDGEEALARFEVGQFDAVVSDILMPTTNGVRLLEAVHARAPGVPVILLSGFATRGLTDEARAKGAWAVLNKPIDTTIVAEIVARAVASRATPAV